MNKHLTRLSVTGLVASSIYLGSVQAYGVDLSATDCPTVQVQTTTSTVMGRYSKYCVVEFRGGSNSITVPAGVQTISLLVVGGGGGGGHSWAGGGGAGGVLFGSSYPVTAGATYNLSVGAGGSGAANGSNAAGSNGSDSTFGSLVAKGGGGGAGYGWQQTYQANGNDGGSGGGSGEENASVAQGGSSTQQPFANVAAYGNRGGNQGNTSGSQAGAGGGGAGGAGGDVSASSGFANRQPSNGGPGLSLGSGKAFSVAAGGGGGSEGVRGLGGTVSGARLGGNGGSGTDSTFIDATANSGSGGGGGHNTRGGNGSAGIVVVAFAYDVKYDGNGATSGSVPAAQIKGHGTHSSSTVTVSSAGTLAKTGSSFLGWNTAANGTGTSYAAGSTYSADASVTLYAQWSTAPAAPTNLVLTSAATSVDLSWTAANNNGASVTNYWIEYKTRGGNWTGVVRGASNATTATVSSLVASSIYSFRVRAENSVGLGPWSEIRSVFTAAGMLSFLDASDENSYSGSGTTWIDLTGKSNSVTSVNAPTFDASAKGFDLDGSSQYFTYGSNKFSFSGTQTHTIHVLFSPDTPGGGGAYETLFGRHDAGVKGSYWLGFGSALYAQRELSPWEVSGSTPLVANQKYLATFVYNGTSVQLYLNGRSEASTNIGSIFDQNIIPLIGAKHSGGNPANYFDGKIFSVSVFDTALTSSQVSAFAQALDTAPAAPTISSISSTSQQLSVSFSAGSNSGTEVLKYQYSTDGGSTWRDRSSGTTASPLVISTRSSDNAALAAGTSYNVQIRAVNLLAGAPSSTTSAATLSSLTNASAPTAAPTAGTLKSIDASWSAVANASSYTMKIYAANGSTLLQTISGIVGTSKTITSADYASIADNTTYQISIQAVGTGSFESSSESTKTSVTTALKLLAPGSVAVSATAATALTVTFNSVANASSYTAQLFDANGNQIGSNYVNFTSGSRISGLTASTAYSVKLIAVGNGTAYLSSDPSSGVSATTTVARYLTFAGTSSQMASRNSTVIPATGDFTVEAWVSPSDYSSSRAAAVIVSQGTASGNRFYLKLSDIGKLIFYQDSAPTEVICSNNPIALNTWTHVAISVSGTTGTCYVNGVAQLSGSLGSQTRGSNFYVGGYSVSPTSSTTIFAGLIDEVKIWNVARTATQIANNTEAAPAASDNTLVAYYPFDAASGTSAVDIKGSNDLTLGTTMTWSPLIRSITYQAGTGGSGSSVTDSTPSDHTSQLTIRTALLASGFSRSGHTIQGWNTQANGSGASYAFSSTYSGSASLTLQAQWETNALAPTIATQPVSLARNSGESATYSVVASVTDSGSLSYQWQKDGTDILGATSASYLINSVVGGDAGTYRVLITNTKSGTTSVTTSDGAKLVVAGTNVHMDAVSSSPGSASATGRAFRSTSQVLPSGSFTIEGWVREKTTSVNQNPIFSQGSNNTNRLTLMIDGTTNRVFRLFSGASKSIVGTTTLAKSKWHHYAVTYDGTTVRLYLNGELEGSVTDTLNLTGTFFIGENAYYTGSNSAHFFHGKQDHVKIWTAVLTQSEIKTSMYTYGSAGVTGKTLRSLYDFDQQNSSTLTDVLSGINLASFGTGSFTWLSSALSVNLDEQGGSAVSNGTFDFFNKIAQPATPTKAGSTFSGWSTTSAGSTISFPYSFIPMDDVTLYAIWETTLAITTPSSGLSATAGQAYTLNISASGGDGAKSYSATGLPSGLSINTSTGVISGTPSAAGNSTVAVTVSDSTGSKTTSNFTISVAQVPLGNAADPTVTATSNTLKSISVSWSAVTNASSYTIKLYASDGTTLLHTITGASGTTRTITASDYASIADNTIYRVSIQAIGTGNYSSSAESGKVSVTTLSQRTITFDSNSGSSVSPISVNPGSAAAKPSDPTRSGFRFAGWSTTETSNQGDLANRIRVWPYTPSSSLTLYAIWVDDYSINFAGTNPASARKLGTDGSPIEIIPKNQSFTVEAWIKPTQKANNLWSAIVHNGSPANDDLGRFMFYVLDTGDGPFLSLNYKTTSNKGGYGYGVPGTITYNTWQHVAVTFTRTGAAEGSATGVGGMEYRFFINGTAARIRNSTSTSTNFGSLVDADFSGDLRSLGLVIGDSINRTNQEFIGAIDQVKIWEGALSAAELSVSRSSFGVGTVSKTLRAHYGFNDLASTTASSQKLQNLTSDSETYDLELFSASAGNVPTNISRSLNSFSISYNGNSATSGSVASATDLRPFSTTSLASQGNLLRTGFAFGGWRTQANGGTEYAAGSNFVNTYGDVELFANWSANSYAISFNANGATGGSVPSNQSKIHDTTLTLATNSGNLVRTGYTFAGWATQADGGGTQYAAGGSYTLNVADELFARWTANSYTITYDSNGGSSTSNGSFTVGGAGLTLPIVTRSGYTLAGWYEAADFSGSALTSPYSPAQTRTVYAKWTANTYTVTYTYNSANGGERPVTNTFTVGGSAITLPTPTRTGYTFNGWYAEVGLATLIGAGGDTYSPTGSVTIYAKWTTTLAITTPTSGLSSPSNQAYTLTLATSGGSGTNSFAVTGTLPTGLSINSSTGVISGTPTTVGNSSITVTVTDSSGANKTTSSFTISVTLANCSPETDTSSAPGYTILRFKTTGQCNWVVPSLASSSEVLVVAGGGGGAFGNNAGGGGAGEVLVTGSATLSSGTVSGTSTVSLTPGDNITITVGGGGTDGAPNTSTATNASSAWSCCSTTSRFGGTGGNSAFGTIIAKGGGGGGGGAGSNVRLSGENGGSGGGGGSGGLGGQAQSLSTYSGWTSFKNNGAAGANGGGGGAGSAAAATRGGSGLTVLGITVAGGGGGWGGRGGQNSLTDQVLGGNGRLTSGTWGYAGDGTNYTSAGVANTGTGGGAGAPGGSGIVVVRYQTAYTVTYSYNSATGGNTTASSSFEIGGTAITLPTPTRTGFTFGGWYEAADFSGSALSSTYSPSQSRTIYAKWNASTNTVTFKSNYVGGDADTTQSISSGTATALTSNAFTRTGYTFAGWNTLANGTGTNYTNQQSVTLSGNLTLYAKWTANTYTVTYNYNSADGGTRPATDSFTVGGSAVTLPTPTRTGYTFGGWYGEIGLSTLIGNAAATYSPTANITLFAKWNANTNTVTFVSNFVGGANDTTQSIVTAVSTALTSNSFTRTGYVFSGWNTLANGTGTNYTNGQSVTITGALTLYAKWTAGTYTVTYNYNSATGGNTVASGSYTTGGANLALPTPTRTGYTFAGWYDDSGFTGSALDSSITTSSSKTIYAKWTAATFTVLYEYNSATGGNGTASSTYTTASTTITLPTPTRTGYTFAGWYEASNFAGSAVTTPYTTSQNRSLYAKWTAVNYTVTYNANLVVSGNTITGTGSVPVNNNNYNIGQSFSVAANTGPLTRSGYTFAGWVTNQDGSGTAKNSGETITFEAANINLYPKWTANTYTIAYNLNGGSGDLTTAPTSWTVGNSNVTLPSSGFTRTGYNFAGWSMTQGGAVIDNSFSNIGNVTLYAAWTLKSIAYTFDKGTAAGQTIASWPSNSSANFGSTITLPTPGNTVTISSVTYQFFGWEYSGTTYQPGSTFTLSETAPTFVAQWVRLYDVRYAYAGGNHSVAGDTDDECVTGGLCLQDQDITLRTAPTRSGYNFIGWRVQDTNTTKAAGALHRVISTGYLFYANWQAIDYVFSFNSSGGSESHSSVTANIGQLVTMPNPGFRVGYTFAGWSPDNGTTKYTTGSTFTVGTSSRAFVAYWTPNVYTVVYDWQGASGTPTPDASYTVGTGNLSLPVLGDRTKDGYTFGGWSETPGGSAVSNFAPTANDVLYAIWNDGNYTLSYNGQGASAGSGSGTVGRGQSVTLPTPIRAGFVFNGWYDAATGGNKIGNGGQSHTPDRSKTLHARWVQKSLAGVDPATLESANEYTASDNTAVDTTLTHNPTGTSARVKVPAGALPNGTKVNVQYFRDTDRQSRLIPGENSYFFSVLVSWLSGTGSSATVPNTSAGKPIEVTLNNNSIRAGAMVYMVIGDQVTELGRATQNGTVTVELTEDPEIVVAATVPGSPASVVGSSGNQEATISWAAPSTNGGAQITGYTVTASPGGATCTTATTSCAVTGLTNGTAYTFSVVATNSVGNSSAATSGSITPALATYTVTFNSNGGSNVSNGSFTSGGSVSEPTAPTRSGYTFDGWSTVLNSVPAKVTFPYSPGVTNNITLYALWTQVQSSGGGSGGSGPVTTPTPTPTVTPGPTAPPSQIGFKPTLPPVPVKETGPVGSVVGSTEKVTVVADQPSEKIIATSGSWKLEIKPPAATSETEAPVSEKLELQLPVASRAQVSGTGLQPNTTVEAWVFSEPTYIGTIKVGPDGRFDSSLVLPKTLLPGEHTLQIGSLNASGNLVTLSIPMTIKGSVSIGTFRGFVSIFTKDLVGQELTAKVAGKWIRQTPIRNFKNFNYSRLVRFTGPGYNIVIDVYLNKKFYKRFTTRTR